jgi:hypothetical protein
MLRVALHSIHFHVLPQFRCHPILASGQSLPNTYPRLQGCLPPFQNCTCANTLPSVQWAFFARIRIPPFPVSCFNLYLLLTLLARAATSRVTAHVLPTPHFVTHTTSCLRAPSHIPPLRHMLRLLSLTHYMNCICAAWTCSYVHVLPVPCCHTCTAVLALIPFYPPPACSTPLVLISRCKKMFCHHLPSGFLLSNFTVLVGSHSTPFASATLHFRDSGIAYCP